MIKKNYTINKEEILNAVSDINKFDTENAYNIIKNIDAELNKGSNEIAQKVREYENKLLDETRERNHTLRNNKKLQEKNISEIQEKKRHLRLYEDFVNFKPMDLGFIKEINLNNIDEKLSFYEKGEILKTTEHGNEYKFLLAWQTNNNNVNKYSLILTGSTMFDEILKENNMTLNKFNQNKVYCSNRIKFLSKDYYNTSHDYLVKNFSSIQELKAYAEKNETKIFNIISKNLEEIRQIKVTFDSLFNSNKDFKLFYQTNRLSNLVYSHSSLIKNDVENLRELKEWNGTHALKVYDEITFLLKELNFKIVNIDRFDIKLVKGDF